MKNRLKKQLSEYSDAIFTTYLNQSEQRYGKYEALYSSLSEHQNVMGYHFKSEIVGIWMMYLNNKIDWIDSNKSNREHGFRIEFNYDK